MDDSGRDALTAAGLQCGSCGVQFSPTAKFCAQCGARLTEVTEHAEYKQVTVLFADVVHSMDIAMAVGPERLREIMAELVNCTSSVVQRYGGTVDKFTGDGIMALFGAPMSLEDHALRACRAALDIQNSIGALAQDVLRRDGVELRLRIGLNSGQVITGEIAKAAAGYTAIGDQVGMAQRMESVAPPGAVMLSESTGRLVDGVVVLADVESVHIKGVDWPVVAYRLLGVLERDHSAARAESNLVGRHWEMSAVEGLLDRAIAGQGAVVTVVGSPGIGKSRLVREVAGMAATRGVDVFTAYCESHATDIPFHVVSRLLRATTGVRGLDAPAARAQVRARSPDADPEDLLLFDDLLGIADPDVELPKIDPDARRRRLTALVNAASLARHVPAVYVIEDAHWIDEVSESMLADFLTVIPQAPSLVLVTYRPEYHGGLSRVAGAKTIALAPLSDPETAALVSQLLGPDPSVGALATVIAERAAGNPFFAEEMVRDLAERAVLRGNRSAYESTADVGEVSVPATLQATIAARIDRLDPAAKRTLSAAAVIGSKFSRDLLETLGIDPVLDDLVGGELVDQITFTGDPAYVFHHPLIRTVAYESQLKSDRAQMHRRVAAAIEAREPDSAEQNAALIAEHLEAAGDGYAAYGWHMRAGMWSLSRDIRAARISWQRAHEVADRLGADEPDRDAMRVAPRTLLCGTAWRVGAPIADTSFAELRELATASGDRSSLALGMAGLVAALYWHGDYREASRLASDAIAAADSLDDTELLIRLLHSVIIVKLQTGHSIEVLGLAQRMIDLADGDPGKGRLTLASPLAVAIVTRGLARATLGIQGWDDDFGHAMAVARAFDLTTRTLVALYANGVAISTGLLVPDATTLRESAEILALAEQSGEDFTLAAALSTRGLILGHHADSGGSAGLELLTKAQELAARARFSMQWAALIDIRVAREVAASGDVGRAIEMSRTTIDMLFDSGEMGWRGVATTALVELLLHRSGDGDIQEAQAAVDRLASAPVDVGFVLYQLPLLRLRALLARAYGDDTRYRDYRDRYREMATSLGFEGHMKWAEAMP